jgi:hypothetical protein
LVDLAGTAAIALWVAQRMPACWTISSRGTAWVTPVWAAMATALMTLAWLMRRRTFLVQGIALAAAVFFRGAFFDLFAPAPEEFRNGALFHLGLAALILIAGLPACFRLRGPEFWQGAVIDAPEPLAALLRRPEQWFFFAPFALMVTALAVRLNSGHITLAWSLLGVCVFLFALAVGERSFRLAGLILLLVCVGKILLMDLWALPLSDRFPTMIVLGLALVAVSFLYARYGKTIRKYL